MKKIKSNIWNYYLSLPIKKKIKREIFFQRLKRFIKSKKGFILKGDIYDFIFLKVVKKDFLKYTKIFSENKINFK